MLSKRHHIKALTMLELLIVLAVSSIVFAAAGKCYEIIFRQSTTIRKVADSVEEVHRLYYILERDVFKAAQIIKEEENALFMQNDSLPVSYRFNEQVITRSMAGRTDTFHIAASELELNVMPEFRDVQLVDKIRFRGRLFEKKENFVFKKIYSAQTLLNFEADRED